MKANGDLEKAIAADPSVQTRLDLVRVRLPAIIARDLKARTAEQSRLEILRSLVVDNTETKEQAPFKHLAGKLAEIATAFLVEDHDAAGRAAEELQKHVKRITSLVEEAKAKDHYLFAKETDDKDAASVPIEPFTKDMMSQLSAFQGWIAWRKARIVPDVATAARQLQEAVKAADAAVGADKNNALAHYVLGVANEESGLVLTRQATDSQDAHQRAKPLFASAVASLAEAERSLAGKPGADKILADIKSRRDKLQGPRCFLDKAQGLTEKGVPDQAVPVLREGLERNRDAALWVAMTEARLRAQPNDGREALKELNKALSAGVFDAADYRPLLLKAKASLVGADSKIGQSTIDTAARRELETAVASALNLLGEAKIKAPSAADKAQCDAYLARFVAYQTILALPTLAPGKSPSDDPQLRGAKTRAERAEEDLQREMDRYPARYDLKEAMVALKMALGYLSLHVEGTGSYRDTALRAFTDAVTLANQLPYGNREQSLLGKPVLDALRLRPDSSAKLAADEYQLREVMTHFLEGAIALQLGQAARADGRPATSAAATAVNRMSRALTEMGRLDKDLQTRERELRDTLEGIRVLGQIKANQNVQALVTALRAAGPTGSVPTASEDDVIKRDIIGVLREAAKKVASPQLAFALAHAFEEFVASFGLKPVQAFGSDPERSRKELLAGARDAYARVKDLVSALPTPRQNPALVEMSNEALDRRLAGPDYFDDEARKRLAEYRFGEADKLLVEGLARHPTASVLWQLLLELRIDQADLGAGPASERMQKLRDILALLENLPREHRAERLYWEGALQERLGNYRAAAAAYQKAVDDPLALPETRLQARTRLVLTQLASGPMP